MEGAEVTMKNRSKPRPGKHTADTPAVDTFTRSALASDLTWLPDTMAVGKPPLTAEAYVEAYLADPGEWYWTTLLLHDPSEIVLKRVLAIIDQAQLPGHEQALGQLGAGPLEDMMSEELLDRLQHWLPFTPAMRHALSQVRMSSEPPVLQQRLKAMLSR
ncbi:hypothetical protein ELI02_05420 [Rhizobium leguminosarum]|uniref:Uncharacterized protein n=2 Tax=Rhizobium/Agrobacterium group TaxID=227290 RepID=A0A4Q8XW39_RHILE|nr:hypothetical protein ELI41_04325 [Rhizobium leguminosarum]TAV47522.1 hypothetical protein ELI32_04420 [Rhizobium leguminosarum]TAV57102.1 hypothetical protein ELI31_04420 [Rhizobium leguminosarum]TAV68041.1 hypothetical protein ELI30_04420 [Rhizobium leguminosarum]TAV88508.1 hypothetical protein ELI22_04415 [Rhizobium leguminosarum]